MAIGSSDFGSQTGQMSEAIEKLKESTKYFEQIANSLSKTAAAINSVSEGSDKGIKRTAGAVQDLADATEAANDAADKATQSQKNFNNEIKKAAEQTEEYEKMLERVGQFAGVFGDSLTSATTSTIGLVKAGGNLIGMLANVGMTIVSLPFKLWDAFVEKSMNMPYNPAFAQMKEDVREMFGSLKSGAGKEIMDGYKEMRSEMAAFGKETGLSMQKVFGFGVEGKAAMLGFMKDVGQGLGSQLGPIMKQMHGHLKNVTYAVKGMGLSMEENGAAMKFFYNSGQNAATMIEDMGKTAAMMAKQTGFNIKTLSKAMVETTSAFPQFAKGGVKAMAEVAHYTHNLGIEVKDLQAVFEKFDSFDQAAESASQLSQAFGVNIDAMKMVKEQSPTKRMEELRNAFKAAGKDINQMTQAEKRLAEQTVGLSGAAFEAAFGEGNKKKALSESEKAAQAATRAAKDQTAAMKELALAIKRVIPPQAEKYKGFFDAFSKGFSDGMFHSENLRKMFVNLQATFRDAYWFGYKLSKLLFDNFPGMDKLAKGFTQLFDPAKFREFFDRILKEFGAFFNKAEKDPKAGMRTLMQNIKKIFMEMFGGSGTDSALNSIKEGIKTILSVLGGAIGEGLKMLLEMTVEGLKNLAAMIRDPSKLSGAAGEAGGMASSFFGPIIDSLADMGPALGDAFIELLSAAFDRVKGYLAIAAGVLATFWAVKFGAGMAIGITKIVAPIVLKAMLENMATSLAPAASPPLPPGATGPAGATGTGAQIGNAIKATVEAFNEIKIGKVLTAAAVMAVIALTFLAAVGVLVWAFAKYAIPSLKETKIEDVNKFAITMAAMAGAILALTPSLFAMSMLRKAGVDVGDIALVTLLVVLLVAAVADIGVSVVESLKKVGSVDPSAIAAFAVVMVSMSVAILATLPAVVALGIMSKFLSPDKALIAVVLVGILGLLLTAVGSLAVGMLAGVADSLSPATAARMVVIAQAFAIFTEGLVNIGKAVMFFAVASLNPLVMIATIASMSAITAVMIKELPEMIKKTMEAMKDYTPDEVLKKMQAVNAIVNALAPMMQVATSLSDMAKEMAKNDIKADKISEVLGQLKTTFDSIITSVKGIVTTIITQATGLNESQVASVQAVASLLGPVSTVLDAMFKPMNDMLKMSQDRGWFSLKSNDGEAFEANMAIMNQAIKGMVPGLTDLMGTNGPIDALLKVISETGKNINKEQMESMKAFGETTKSVIEGVKFFIDTFTKTTEDANTKKPNVAVVEGLKESLESIRTVLFDGKTGFMTGIINDLTDPTKFNLDPGKADLIKKKASMIETLLGPVKSLVGIMKDVPPPVNPGPISNLFGTLKEALFGKGEGEGNSLKALLNEMSSALADVGKKGEMQKIANLKPLFDALVSLSGTMEKLGSKTFDATVIGKNISAMSTMLLGGNVSSSEINNIKDLVDAMLAPDVMNIFDVTKLTKFENSIKKVDSIVSKLASIADKGGDASSLSAIGTSITSFAENIMTADGKLTGKLNDNSGVAKVVKDLGKLGKINVQHNLPGVTMHVSVTLDSGALAKELAPQIIRVDLNKDVTKSRTIAVTQDGQQDKTLM